MASFTFDTAPVTIAPSSVIPMLGTVASVIELRCSVVCLLSSPQCAACHGSTVNFDCDAGDVGALAYAEWVQGIGAELLGHIKEESRGLRS